jgi:signal transduction histidine kinase
LAREPGVVPELASSGTSFDGSASSRGGVVEASTRTEKDSGICIAVKDRGCGIHPDHVSDVFEPFFTTNRSVKAAIRIMTVIGMD